MYMAKTKYKLSNTTTTTTRIRARGQVGSQTGDTCNRHKRSHIIVGLSWFTNNIAKLSTGRVVKFIRAVGTLEKD